jgi:hypothetical protein
MARITGVTLGTVIAFVAPGFVGLIAASYHSPLAAAWLSAAVESDQSVGVFFFVLLASLALGIVISGVRALVLDYLYHNGIRFVHYARIANLEILAPVEPSPRIPFDRIADARRLAAFESIVESYFRFYQFYGNTFVALLFLLVSRVGAPWGTAWPGLTYVLIVGALVVLFFSARMSLDWYGMAAASLFESDGGTHEQRPTTGKQEEITEDPEAEEGPEEAVEKDTEEEGQVGRANV